LQKLKFCNNFKLIMKIRSRKLPAGWYPDKATELEAMLKSWSLNKSGDVFSGIIAPHAGWFFSGKIAWQAWQQGMEADCIAIIGGHLPAEVPFMYFAEDGFSSPKGVINNCLDLTDFISSALQAIPDERPDNTIEVHLPMAAERYPNIPLACFRAPNSLRAAQLGLRLAEYAKKTNKRIFAVASTDLTHYGRDYGFEPGGPGPKGFAWARKADNKIIDSFLALNEQAAFNCAEEDSSACSVGAVIALIAYLKEMGALNAKLVARGSSDDIMPGNSNSVGYCSIGYSS
jgi:AmmeMemoRadiSam system protein B